MLSGVSIKSCTAKQKKKEIWEKKKFVEAPTSPRITLSYLHRQREREREEER